MMDPIRFGLAVALAIFGATPPVAAQDTLKWATVGEWEVAMDKTVAGCFAWAQYDGGTIFRIGFRAEHTNGYIIIANVLWNSLEVGKEYPINLKFGSAEPWIAEATAINMHGVTALMLGFEHEDLALEFMRKQNVAITYMGRQIDNLNLAGSFAAFAEVLNCQEAIDGRGAQVDPFSQPTPTQASDPFAP